MADTLRVPGGGRIAPLLLLVVLAAAVHVPALRAPFVGADLGSLEAVRSRSLPAALLLPAPGLDAFRPVGNQLYFWLVSTLWNGSPVAAHALNLALLALALVLLAWVARQLVGSYAAAIAVTIVGFSYALDVPVLWASGARHLLALVGALAAIAFHVAGLRTAAGIALFLGLLAHESVVVVPLIAIAATRRPREFLTDSVQNAWPMFAAVGAWGLLWLAALMRHDFAVSALARFRWDSFPAAFVHLAQVVAGLEWNAGRAPRLHLGLQALALTGLATVLLAWAGARRRPSRGASPSLADRGPRGAGFGIQWATLGTLPLIVSTATWSAHDYLFPLCGAALALGAWATLGPRWLGPALAALLLLSSQHARGLEGDTIRPDVWSARSHLHRHTLLSRMEPVSRYASQLKRLRPRLPAGSTLFFSGVPNLWEAGGGALVRTAYDDSSLRAYDLTEFSLERARRGPAVFFGFRGNGLYEISPSDLRDLGVRQFRHQRGRSGHEALVYAVEAEPKNWLSRYWLVWVEWSRGDTTAALAHLQRLGMKTRWNERFEWTGSWAQRTLAVGDSSRSIELLTRVIQRQALDPEPHRRLATIARGRAGLEARAEAEAYAARVLSGRPASRAWTTPRRSEATAATLP